MAYNYNMANKGKGLENTIEMANDGYLYRGIAAIEKVETGVVPRRENGKITGVRFKGGPKVDFSGFLADGRAVHLETKESEDAKGLPLAHYRVNQIDFMRLAVPFSVPCPTVVYCKPANKYYRVEAFEVLSYWDYWQARKGQKGANLIPYERMKEVVSREGLVLDYLAGYYSDTMPRADVGERGTIRFIQRGRA